MEKQMFISTVRTLVTPQDFQNNQKHLDKVETHMYEAFCRFLKMGGMIIPAIKAMDNIYQVSKETVLTPMQVVELLPKFRWICAMLDERPE